VSTSAILGNDQVEYYSLEEYSVSGATGSSYDWILYGGGLIITSSLPNVVNIQWENTSGVYILSVVETDMDGCLGDTVSVAINLQSGVSVSETQKTLSKTLIKIVDVLGKKTSIETKNIVLFYIYEDGRVVKKIDFN